MPNYCNYQMRIKGTKENCNEFVKRMEDYNMPHHLYRIFQAEVYDEFGTDDDYTMDISGYCAWSIESCCRASGYSNGFDLLEVNTRELDLKLECYSEECGMCFQEHYIYNKGECLADECVEWNDYYWDPELYEETFEEYKKMYNLPHDLTEDDFDDCHYYIGGFGEWLFSI